MASRVKARAPGDRSLLIVVGLLLAFGLVMVYSSSAVLAMRRYGDSAYFFKKQVVWAIMGCSAMFFCSCFDYRLWRRIALPLVAAVGVSLFLVLIPRLGVEINGSRRWLGIGPFGVQPAEFAKLAVLIYIAHVLSREREIPAEIPAGLVPALVVLFVMVVLIYPEPDFGTAVSVAVVGASLLFIGGLPWRYFSTLLLLAVPTVVAMIYHASYRRERILSFLDPWKDPT